MDVHGDFLVIDSGIAGLCAGLSLVDAGDVSCTGVHGANRLASNSLLEGLVFGARAMEAMKAAPRPAALPASDVIEDTPSGSRGGAVPSADEVRELMWRHVGVLRDRPSLERAVAELQAWAGAVAGRRPSRGPQPEMRRVLSILTTGLLIARAALRRTESRGAHFRSDFPSRDDLHWKTRTTERLHAD